MYRLLALVIAFAFSPSLGGAQDLNLRDATFEEVIVTGDIELEIRIGEDYAFDQQPYSGPSERLDARIEDGVFIVSLVDRGLFILGRKDRIALALVMPSLKTLTATSNASVRAVAPVALETIKADSDARMVVSQANLDAIVISAINDAVVFIDGSCATIDAAASSDGSIEAKDFVCAQAALVANSDARIVGHATDQASITAGSDALIKLYGGAEVTSMDLSGDAQFRPME